MGELFSWAPFKFSETSYPLLGYLILGFFYPSHQAILVLKPIMRKNWGRITPKKRSTGCSIKDKTY